MKELTFTLFWLTGNSEIVKGINISSACNNSGIGAGALRSLDFYDEGDCRNNYTLDKQKRTWVTIKNKSKL